MTEWYLSKTLWGNVIAAGALFVSTQYGYVISGPETALIFSAINFMLRSITGSPLETDSSIRDYINPKVSAPVSPSEAVK